MCVQRGDRTHYVPPDPLPLVSFDGTVSARLHPIAAKLTYQRRIPGRREGVQQREVSLMFYPLVRGKAVTLHGITSNEKLLNTGGRFTLVLNEAPFPGLLATAFSGMVRSRRFG